VRRLPSLLAALALAALAGCGDDGQASGAPEVAPLTVSAAASLTDALTACSREPGAAPVRLSFAGSDELAAQIRQGARVDVFAAANTRLPEELAAEGLLEAPVAFATNELVVAVPADSDVRSVADLAEDGVELAIGAEGVPVGDYTRELLSRLPRAQRDAILANVRSNEPDVRGVVGRLTQGAGDAGFVYASDVAATDGALRAIALPERLRPTVAYGAGVVAASERAEAARAYVEGLRRGPCARALRDAGLGASAR
jgi:molybdate transport system substrate-binding protein